MEMTIFSDSGFYEVDFNNSLFKHLQYMRMDTICEVLYVTMKDVLTGEILTFEQNGIKWIRKMSLNAEILPSSMEAIAQNHYHSLY
jgi:hypothetical protein